jgi:hypothetical protein
MKKEFLKIAGVENEKDFYKLFPTEAAFFGIYPEAKKLVQKKMGGLIKAQAGFELMVPAEPTPNIYNMGPANLDYFNQYVPEYKKTYGVPNKRSGDTFDQFKWNLINQGVPKQNATNIASFMNQYYDSEGNLKKVRLQQPPIKPSKKRKSMDDPEEQRKKIEKYKKIQGVMGVDYYKMGGLIRAQEGIENGDLNLGNQKKEQLLKWYQGRLNHPDPRISGEAKQVLENMNANYSEDFSKDIEHKPFEHFINRSVYGSYDPKRHKVQLTNPSISFKDQIDKIKFIPKKLIKSNLKEYEDIHKGSLTDEVRGHELLHYFLEKSAMPVIGKKHNKTIYSNYTDPDTYTKLVYEREGKPFLEGRDKIGFIQGSKGIHTWLTGTANTNLNPLPFKKPNPNKMSNQEMYRALMEFRNEFQIDPSKNTTPEDFKNIYQKTQENYQKAIKEKDHNKTLRYEHFLDLFNIHGNDFEKLNNLNNLLVGNKSSQIPMAREGFAVTDTTTKSPGILNYLKTAGNIVFATPHMAASNISKKVKESPFLSHPVTNLLDFTGVTNYPYFESAVADVRNAKGFWPKLGYGALAVLEGAASLPAIGPEVKLAKKTGKGVWNTTKKGVKNLLTPVEKIDKLTNKIIPVQALTSKAIKNLPKPVQAAMRFGTVSNRGNRFFHGASAGYDQMQNKFQNMSPYSGENVKLRMPDGTIITLHADDPRYKEYYDNNQIGSWNSVDSSFNVISK